MPAMNILTFALLIAVIFMAAVIRGYGGFGFSLAAIVPLTMIMPPAQAVPVILMLEMAGSIRHLPLVWRQVDWASLRWLFIGAAIGTPIGIRLLSTLAPRPMQAAIAATVFGLSLLLWRKVQLARMPGRTQTTLAGIGSGLLNGGGAIGGPPVILFYLSSPKDVAVSRASMIAFFLGLDGMAIGFGLADGLVTHQAWITSVFCLLPLWVGIGVGNRWFGRSDPERFRRKVLILLMLLAAMAFVRAFLGM